MGWIYLITNDQSDKVYVGQTTGTINKRFNEHLRHARCGGSYYLDRAIRHYGEEHFHIEPLEECTNEKLNEQERYWIKYYDSYNYGYNLTIGGEGRPKHDYNELAQAYLELGTAKAVAEKYHCTQNVVQRACEAVGVEIKRFILWEQDGYKKSEAGQKHLEQIRELGKSKKGIILSPEHRKKISEARKGKYAGENSPMYGKKFTQEHKDKLSQNSAWAKPVQCIETGEIYRSACKAAEAVGLKSSAGISKCCYGQAQTAGKLHWQFYVKSETEG